MFRIRQIHDAKSLSNQVALASVLQIYEDAFSYYPQYTLKIAELLKFPSLNNFEVILLVAEGQKGRVLGFALSFYFPKLKFAYLDYIASSPKRSRRGFGATLYDATRAFFLEAGAKGIFMDVPPDDLDRLKEKNRLQVNRRRMAFYEQFGAYPITGTKYELVTHAANQGYHTYLVYDGLVQGESLTPSALKRAITRILEIKGNLKAGDPKLKQILASIGDEPVKLRPPRYTQKAASPLNGASMRPPLDFVTTGDAHQIHHLREKGYVERPARVNFILKGLDGFELREKRVKNYAEKHILDVHHPNLFRFLKQAERKLEPNQFIYPNVFPIRKANQVPKNWEMQAGYYCIDTFTPVTSNSFKAAKSSVNSALTGADLVLDGREVVYVLCRPPGHHAESRVFGGFCYFNSAAIAANYLAGRKKRVAFLDIDYHHGNGSQEIFYKRDDVYFVSIHGHPKVSYPYFSGYSDEIGEGPGLHFNLNYPLYPGVQDEEYLKVLNRALKKLRAFGPDYLVLSLGFDIMMGDPTGAFNISPGGMKKIGQSIAQFPCPKLIVQEGGYALKNLRLGAQNFFMGLLIRDA